MLEDRVSNSEHDVYPASWAPPENQLIKAFEDFVECR
jgi:hypothetical protein